MDSTALQSHTNCFIYLRLVVSFVCLLSAVDRGVDSANTPSANQSFSLVNQFESLGNLPVDTSCFCDEGPFAVVKKSCEGCLETAEDGSLCPFCESFWRIKYVA